MLLLKEKSEERLSHYLRKGSRFAQNPQPEKKTKKTN